MSLSFDVGDLVAHRGSHARAVVLEVIEVCKNPKHSDFACNAVMLDCVPEPTYCRVSYDFNQTSTESVICLDLLDDSEMFADDEPEEDEEEGF